MGFERDLSPVAPILFTANGGTEGQITLATTLGLFVKQIAQLNATGQLTLTVEIKSVISETQILVGPPKTPITTKSDVSAYTTALGANISAAKQPKATLPMESRLYASYIQEPSNSWRVTPVDSFGNSIDSTNPLPVAFDGTVNIGDVHIVGPAPENNELDVNNDGSINVNIVNSTGNSTTKLIYNEAPSVPSGTRTTIVTYTVPPATTSYLQLVSGSGENVGRYDVLVSGNAISTKRSWWTAFNVDFNFAPSNNQGYPLTAGTVVQLVILQNSASTATFDGTIQVVETT